ncbi:MAG: hypothetical protein HOM95_07195 [Halieaceae bacterium]|nr:hypothetical protein [Halieaceae bacterium]
MKRILLIVLFLSGGPLTAYAADGKLFLKMCKEAYETTQDFPMGMCDGYIVGVVETHDQLAEMGRMERMLCFPQDQLDLAQLRAMGVKWLEENPDRIHQPVPLSLFIAWGEAYSCPKY